MSFTNFQTQSEQAINRPSRPERIALKREAYLQDKAEGWTVFCAEYNCDDIPEGYVVKNIGAETLSLINSQQPRVGACRLTTDSYDETEHIEGKVRRGAALGHRAQPYEVQCGEKISPFTRWEDYLIVYGGRFIEDEPGRNHVFFELLGPGHHRGTEPKLSYASRKALLQPASAGFDLFDPELDPNRARVYLSKSPMFHGRRVVLICNFRCRMQTVSFAEDQGLRTLHIAELIQFSWQGTKWDSTDCKGLRLRWECGPPMDELLASMASYVRFIDQAFDAARRPPLPKLE